MESEAPLLKRTLLMVAAMVASCIVFVGTLSLVAMLIVSKAVGPAGASAANAPEIVPAANVHGAAPGFAAQPAPAGAPVNAPRVAGKLL
jgi:hypothetical protein